MLILSSKFKRGSKNYISQDSRFCSAARTICLFPVRFQPSHSHFFPYIFFEGAMSSPSSVGPTKRKRGSSFQPSMQPSSRDASCEDAADSASQFIITVKHKNSNLSGDIANPPSKRARTRSNVALKGLTVNGNSAPDSTSDNDEAEVNGHPNRRARSLSVKELPDQNVVDNEAMAPPVKAGLQDPVGFHTNPPPTGRAVRIYADGVFDLFHLGYVHNALLNSLLKENPGICVSWSRLRPRFQKYTCSWE